MSLTFIGEQTMKVFISGALLLMSACLANAQQAPQAAPNAQAIGQGDSVKLIAFKKKLTDGIDMRIGKLEELEECIQAAPDTKAIKACREKQVAEAANSKN